MMSSFAISGSLTLKSSPGVKFTGNCGSVRPLIFVDNSRPPTSPNRKFVSVFAIPSFLKVLAGHFRPASNAPGASSSMFATNSVLNTRESNVPFGQIKPVLTVSEIREREAQLKFRALHSQPVTPIKVDRLESFLQRGYDSVLSKYLIDGFRFGFRVHFVGERLAYESSNLKSALNQPGITEKITQGMCSRTNSRAFHNPAVSPLSYFPAWPSP